MSNKTKTERRVNDTKMYLAVIYELLADSSLTFNDVPLPEVVRSQAALNELIKLLSVLGIKREDFGEYLAQIDISDETSAETRELSSAINQAIAEVKASLGA